METKYTKRLFKITVVLWIIMVNAGMIANWYAFLSIVLYFEHSLTNVSILWVIPFFVLFLFSSLVLLLDYRYLEDKERTTKSIVNVFAKNSKM